MTPPVTLEVITRLQSHSAMSPHLTNLIPPDLLSTVGRQRTSEFLGLLYLGGVIKVQSSHKGTWVQNSTRTLHMVEAVFVGVCERVCV